MGICSSIHGQLLRESWISEDVTNLKCNMNKVIRIVMEAMKRNLKDTVSFLRIFYHLSPLHTILPSIPSIKLQWEFLVQLIRLLVSVLLQLQEECWDTQGRALVHH